MKLWHLLVICVGTAVMGIFFFALITETIIIKIPARFDSDQQIKQPITKKNILFICYKNGQWYKENTELIWHSTVEQNIQITLSGWLTWMFDEKCMQKKILLQSVIITDAQEAYLSFDRNPFNKEQSTFEKWMWIETLLKVIKENSIPVSNIYFLVHNQPINDFHLDFSVSWPVSGFLIRSDDPSINSVQATLRM